MDSIQGEASPSEMDCCTGPLPKGVTVMVLYIKSNPSSPLRRPKSDPRSIVRQELGRCQHPRLERRET